MTNRDRYHSSYGTAMKRIKIVVAKVVVLLAVIGTPASYWPISAQEQGGSGQFDREPPDMAPDEDRRGPPRPDERMDRQPRQGPPPENRRGPSPGDRRGSRQSYSIEQAVSDQAQLHTIAFNGLAFITGCSGASSFIPPGKVCDFFGFQYMRDIDAAGAGHNPKFLDRVAGNVLSILSSDQRAIFEREANSEATQMRDLAFRRFPLIWAFHRQLDKKIPAGSSGLNKAAVEHYAGTLFTADAALAYQRAQTFGQIISSLNQEQKAALARMQFGNFNSWPAVNMEQYKLGRGRDHLVNVAYMTLASEFFSWYAGSVQADTYFCPERHGTYFGGFFLKDMPAMGQRDFNISTSLTGDLGQSFLQALNQEQRKTMYDILEKQRKPLSEIVETRRDISTELRRFRAGQTPNRERVLALGRRYGELDGELAFTYAVAFARVGQSLTADQRQTLHRLRNDDRYTAAPAYLYSTALREQPAVEPAEKLFFPRH
jgi:hypothetical protein